MDIVEPLQGEALSLLLLFFFLTFFIFQSCTFQFLPSCYLYSSPSLFSFLIFLFSSLLFLIIFVLFLFFSLFPFFHSVSHIFSFIFFFSHSLFPSSCYCIVFNCLLTLPSYYLHIYLVFLFHFFHFLLDSFSFVFSCLLL